MALVYVCGHCINSGKPDAVGGIGVYFGPGDTRNYSGRLKEGQHTQHKADVEAIRQALIQLGNYNNGSDKRKDIVIRSDSSHAIKSIGYRWKAGGDFLENKTNQETEEYIIEDAAKRICICGYQITLQQVRYVGHDPRNIMARNMAMMAINSKIFED